MKEQYYIDLAKYELEKFKLSLKNRKMIPSRVILKENLEERFDKISSQGINNLQELIDALKKRQNIETFSKKSGLPIDYLTILKREASSYLPNPVNLNKYSGIDNDTIKSLESIGIKNTKHFFTDIRIQLIL